MKNDKIEPMLDLASLPVEKTEKTTRFSMDKSIGQPGGFSI